MGSEVTELMTVPRKVYLSSVENCCDSKDAFLWIPSEREPRVGSCGRWKDGVASRLAVRSMKRGVLGNISRPSTSKIQAICYNGYDAVQRRKFAWLLRDYARLQATGTGEEIVIACK